MITDAMVKKGAKALDDAYGFRHCPPHQHVTHLFEARTVLEGVEAEAAGWMVVIPDNVADDGSISSWLVMNAEVHPGRAAAETALRESREVGYEARLASIRFEVDT